MIGSGLRRTGQNKIMKLKFTKTVPAGRKVFQAGETYEIKDRHAAEVYVAHGYAVATEGTAGTETLRHSHPATRPKSAVHSPESKVQSQEPAKGQSLTGQTPNPASK